MLAKKKKTPHNGSDMIVATGIGISALLSPFSLTVSMCGKIFLNIRNNLRKKGFESFEEICMYSKILRKLTYYVQKF